MRPSTFLFAILPAVAVAQTQTGSAGPETTGKTHWVSVGENGLEFTPDSLQAAVGDQVSFSFYPSNHAVARSTFNNPCSPMPANADGAIYSGFPDTENGKSDMVFNVWINDTKPIWLYCPPHCNKEMVMVINPENPFRNYRQGSQSNLAAYKKASANASPNNSGPENPPVVGGTLVAAAEASGTWSGSASAPTQTDGAMAGVRPEWLGVMAGLAAWLI